METAQDRRFLVRWGSGQVVTRLIVALLLVLACAGRAFASDAKRYPVDQEDVTRMELNHRHALELMDRGEGELRAGKISEAADLFQQAAQDAPECALVHRRHCQALTLLGKHSEAVMACRRAVTHQGSGVDFRALAGAMMSGDALPTPEDMAHALIAAGKAREFMTSEPWGYAAECDMAARVGDTEMFNACLDDLQRVAPDHYETRRALATAKVIRPRWWVGLGWGALGAVLLGTLAHALYRLRRSAPNPVGAKVAGMFALAAVLGGPHFAIAAPEPALGPDGQRVAGHLSKWVINESDPESSIPNEEERNRSPLEFGYFLMDMTDRGEAALKAHDYRVAVKYYQALAKAVPNRAVSYSKICSAYDALGDTEKAIENCQAALGRGGVTVGDYTHYVRLMVSKNKSLTKDEIEGLNEVVEHLKSDDAGRAVADEAECQIAVRLGEEKRLARCSAALAAKSPDDPKTISYQWALAILRKDYGEAGQLIDRARTSMAPEEVQRMVDTTREAQPLWRRHMHDWRAKASLAILLSAALSMMLVWRRSASRPVAPSVPG